MGAELQRRVSRFESRARAAWASGDYARARRSWQRVRELAPRDGNAPVGIACCELALRRPEAALRTLRGCRRRWPRDPRVLLAVGQARLLLGRPKLAERALRAALEAGAGAEAHRALHAALARQGRQAEAEAAINALNGQDHGGRALTVSEAKPREPRGGGRGGYGGGGGGGRGYGRGR